MHITILLDTPNGPIHQETLRRVHKWQTLVSLALARWTGQPFLPISYSEVCESRDE
jgi:hypothetical protein